MNDTLYLSWTWMRALEIAGSGMLTALVVTTSMVLIMKITHVIVMRIDNYNDNKKLPGANAKKVTEQVNDKKVIAAISSAIAFYRREEEGSELDAYLFSQPGIEQKTDNSWRNAGITRMLRNNSSLQQIRRKNTSEKV